jgi:hypothetical protein
MELEELRGRQAQIIVLTGDGKTEIRVLKHCSRIYNGKKTLWYPGTPIPQRTTIEALRAVKVCVESYRILYYLFLIDREHLEKGKEEETIEKVLMNEGFREMEITQLNSLFLVKCLLGPRRIMIYVIVIGTEKRIEEELVELIKLELGVDIEPEKGEIRKVLKSHRMDFEDLLRNAKRENLEEAFSSLCSALKMIETRIYST